MLEHLSLISPDHIRGNYGFSASTSKKISLYQGGFEINGHVAIQRNEQVTWLSFNTPEEFKSQKRTQELITHQINELKKLFQEDHRRAFRVQNTLVTIVDADIAHELTEKYGFQFCDSCKDPDGNIKWNSKNFTLIGTKEIVQGRMVEP